MISEPCPTRSQSAQKMKAPTQGSARLYSDWPHATIADAGVQRFCGQKGGKISCDVGEVYGSCSCVGDVSDVRWQDLDVGATRRDMGVVRCERSQGSTRLLFYGRSGSWLIDGETSDTVAAPCCHASRRRGISPTPQLFHHLVDGLAGEATTDHLRATNDLIWYLDTLSHHKGWLR